MTAYEKYTFFLCLIVFLALTALFTVLLTHVVRLTIRQIKHGLEDEKILKEFYKEQKKPQKSNAADLIARVFSGVVCVALFATFVFAVFLHVNEDEYANRYGALKVVKSGSMAYPYEKNDYLFDNRLNDQIQMMDLIVTEPLPNEFDLKLYDIVVYEQDGKMIIHRIVGIEEPNENHPNERYFKLQGDAVEIADRYPVRYGQMRAIYRGERVPFVGSFVSFMQSPAGWLCVLLVLFSLIVTPIAEKKVQMEKEMRLQRLIYTDNRVTVPVASSVFRKRLATPVTASPVQISHFRLMLTVQKKAPKMELLITEKTEKLKIVAQKRN